MVPISLFYVAVKWILRVARNYTYDLLRRQKADIRRQKALEHRFQQQGEFSVLDFELQDTLRSLPDKYRDVLLLRSVEGFTPSEVGQVMGFSENHVRVLYHRAKKSLQGLLKAIRQKDGFARCNVRIIFAGLPSQLRATGSSSTEHSPYLLAPFR